MKTVNIAFSPCPNDTFIFHAMVHRLVDTGDFRFIPRLYDVETLNEFALAEKFEVTKLSFHAYLHLNDKYEILESGSALGFGCGPLLVRGSTTKEIGDMTIAIPGRYTTAFMLLRLWEPSAKKIIPVRFDYIMEGVHNGIYDAGLIIHEGRFVYKKYGLEQIVDLGEWWEKETGAPIPLGCITARNSSFSEKEKNELSTIIRSSIEYAINNREASREYIKYNAQELDDEVIESHIRLYVNEFSLSLGDQGYRAIRILEKMAREKQII